MKRTTNIISVIMAVLLLISVTSCGKKNEETTTTTIGLTQVFTPETTETFIEETVAYDSTDYYATSSAILSTPATSPESSESTTVINTTHTPTPDAPIETKKQTKPQNATEKVEKTTKQAQQTVAPVDTSTSITFNTENGTYYVYFPQSLHTTKSTYPVLSWANGTMCPPDMYTNLLSAIATKGNYIVIASDETMSADGSAQIAAIDFMLSLNNDSSSKFYKKINTEKIGVIGHSQGGRSSVNVVAKDKRIDCVVSIAGSNFIEEAELNSAPTFFIAGEKDMIVSPSKWIIPAYDVAKGPAVYASLNGAIHTTCCTSPDSYINYIIDWCDAWLKGNKNALSTFSNSGTLSSDSNWSDFKCKNF